EALSVERASSLPPHPHPSTPKTSIFIESLLTVYPDDGETSLDGESEKAKRTGLCQPVLFYVRT
ncbi:hypothetical protein, partial [Bilophila wadsworthia]